MITQSSVNSVSELHHRQSWSWPSNERIILWMYVIEYYDFIMFISSSSYFNFAWSYFLILLFFRIWTIMGVFYIKTDCHPWALKFEFRVVLGFFCLISFIQWGDCFTKWNTLLVRHDLFWEIHVLHNLII